MSTHTQEVNQYLKATRLYGIIGYVFWYVALFRWNCLRIEFKHEISFMELWEPMKSVFSKGLK